MSSAICDHPETAIEPPIRSFARIAHRGDIGAEIDDVGDEQRQHEHVEQTGVDNAAAILVGDAVARGASRCAR